MVRSSLVRSVAGLGTLFVIAAGCDQREAIDPGNRPDGERFFVSITPESDSILVGNTRLLTAQVIDARGTVRSDQAVRWNSLSPNIVSVDGVGLVTGVAPGTGRVLALVGLGAQAHADTATIYVQQGAPALIVAPEMAEIMLGDSLRLEAMLANSSGASVRGLSVAWSVSDTMIATIASDGVITSLAPGDVFFTATFNGQTATASARIRPNPAASITVTPANSGLYPRDSVQLVADVRDERGYPLPSARVRWSSSAPTIAKVTMDGLVVAQSTRGSAIITAMIDARRASATVNVFAVPTATVTVTTPSSAVPLGGRLQATATARDASGNVLTGKTVSWNSSNPAVAQVGATGVITGLTVGSTTINAIIDGKIGSLPMTVISSAPSSIAIVPATATVSLGAASQLTAEVRDQGGNILSGQTVTWSSANPGIASVSLSGVVSGVAAGTTSITATSGTLSAQASITVVTSTVSSVTLLPNSAQLQVGGTQQITPTVMASNGTPVTNPAVSWKTSDPAVAMVSSSGLVTGIAPGNATITATASGTSATASIMVVNAPVASVTVTFNSSALLVGQTTQAVAVARDALGNVVTGRDVAWSSDDPALASVSATGLVTATAGGSATIVARVGGVIGLATLSIGAPAPLPVATVQLTVAPSAILAGQTATSSVTLRDSLGNTLNGRTIGYSSSKPYVASVGLGGVITGVSAGGAVITATSEGRNGTAAMTVNSVAIPTVATVSVTANSTSLTPGQTTQATATARDSAGNVLTGQTVTWLSSNPAAATVSGTGLITAVAAGASTITATAGGKSGSLAVVVVNPPTAATASVTISLPASSIIAGGSFQATAVAKDAAGNTLAGKPITWSSSNTAIASVSAAGLVTGVAAGTANISASSEGKSASASLTVTAALPSGPVPSIAPALPRTSVNVAWPATTRTIVIGPNANLQAVLDTARRGDEIVLPARARYTGNYVVPVKPGSCTTPIVVRSSELSQLPPLGQRVQLGDTIHMPVIEAQSLVTSFVTARGACGWRFVGIQVTVSPTVAVGPTAPRQQGLIYLGDYSSLDSLQQGSDMVLDRMVIRGRSQTNLHRCVLLSGARMAIINSQLLECHGKGFDSQAIGGWSGTGPYLIENNRLEAAGQPIIFGGSLAPTGVVPSDITIRRNYLGRPMAWKGVWSVVFLFEIKNGRRILVEENVMENHWQDVKAGEAIMLGTLDNPCSWCIVSDITFRWNSIDNIRSGFNLIDKYGNAQPMVRVAITNNLITNVGSSTLGAGSPRCYQLQEAVHDLHIAHNTCGAPYGYVALSGANKTRFTFRANAQVTTSGYPFWSSTGMGDAALGALTAPFAVDSNVFIGPSGSVPTGYGNIRLSAPAVPPVGIGVDQTTLTSRLVGVR